MGHYQIELIMPPLRGQNVCIESVAEEILRPFYWRDSAWSPCGIIETTHGLRRFDDAKPEVCTVGDMPAGLKAHLVFAAVVYRQGFSVRHYSAVDWISGGLIEVDGVIADLSGLGFGSWLVVSVDAKA